MNIKPLNGRLLIKTVKESRNESGIILPDSNSSKSIKAEVVSVGPLKCSEHCKCNCTCVPTIDIKIGDIVFCPKWTGTVVSEEHAQEEYIVVKYEDILGIEGK